jgi:hypothetical protein
MAKTKPYYQTTPLTDFELAEMIASCDSQEKKVIAYLSAKQGPFTAWELNKIFPNWPITSVRRALTNLAKKKQVVVDGYVVGYMNKPVGRYKLVEQTPPPEIANSQSL